ELLQELNNRKITFEEIGIPTIPESVIIFEFGIADEQDFSYIDEAEAQKIFLTIEKKPLQIIDVFCIIRYYKALKPKKIPFKFDYYMIRMSFGENHDIEVQVYHERGPRYLGPKEVIGFLVEKTNAKAARKVLGKSKAF
ncbi:MAG: hypothetical protein GX638_15930, partial [Crenarchaeota archaeon]|nr:hypothetical protein [Thermoproteota archaeon]